MVSFKEKYGDKVEFIFVDFNVRNKEDTVLQFIEKYQIEAHPDTLFFDENGEFVNVIEGFNEQFTAAAIETEINSLLK